MHDQKWTHMHIKDAFLLCKGVFTCGNDPFCGAIDGEFIDQFCICFLQVAAHSMCTTCRHSDMNCCKWQVLNERLRLCVGIEKMLHSKNIGKVFHLQIEYKALVHKRLKQSTSLKRRFPAIIPTTFYILPSRYNVDTNDVNIKRIGFRIIIIMIVIIARLKSHTKTSKR